MNKKSIKKLTLLRLLKIFFIAIASIMLSMMIGYREFFKFTIENKAMEISTVVKAGLTSHMKAHIMDKRDYFLEEIKTINNIEALYIIRGKSVEEQFGASLKKNEKSYKDLNNKINLKEASFYWNDRAGIVKAIIPYKASSEGELNCLACHNVQDGETLGALEIDMDIKSYQQLTLHYGYIFIFLLIFFAFIIILIIFNFIEKHITKPLSNILKNGEESYQYHNEINIEMYESQELYSLAQNFNNFNHDVIEKELALKKKNAELKHLNGEIESTLGETIMAMGKIEEIRSGDVKDHTLRVSKLSKLIGKEYGLNDEDVALIGLTSPLHDIGKIGIPDRVLLKPAKLTSSEFEIMKTHTTMGYQILRHSKRVVLKNAADIAYSHHEKYDGSGYPQGLKEDEIPLFARIVAIVDVLDALLCKRVYKEAWSDQDVRKFIEEQKGKHFEPKLVDIVLENFEEYATLVRKLSQVGNQNS